MSNIDRLIPGKHLGGFYSGLQSLGFIKYKPGRESGGQQLLPLVGLHLINYSVLLAENRILKIFVHRKQTVLSFK